MMVGVGSFCGEIIDFYLFFLGCGGGVEREQDVRIYRFFFYYFFFSFFFFFTKSHDYLRTIEFFVIFGQKNDKGGAS